MKNIKGFGLGVKIMKKYRKTYEITLPDKKKVLVWFEGKQLEEILNGYNIPYKIVRCK